MTDRMSAGGAAGDGSCAQHEHWEDVMIAVLDGREAAADRMELEAHLAACAECRGAFVEYRALFGNLRVAARRDERPAEFWDRLAADIDGRVAEDESVRARGDAPAGAPPVSPPPSVRGDVIELGERARLRTGWTGVAGGLVAAGIAVLVLVGVYLKMPRGPGEPQAFTTAFRDEATADGVEPLDAETLAALEAVASDGGPDALFELAAALEGQAADDLGAEAAEPDPLAEMLDVDSALRDLTPAEADELLRSLEAQT